MKNVISLVLAVLLSISLLFPISIVSAEENSDLSIEKETQEVKENLSTYQAYLNSFSNMKNTTDNIVTNINMELKPSNPITFDIFVSKDGLYNLGMTYKSLTEIMSNYIELSFKVDGAYPYPEAEKIQFPKMWQNIKTKYTADANGNEFAPQQEIFNGYYLNHAIDANSEYGTKYAVYLTAGKHQITLSSKSEEIAVESFGFYCFKPSKKYVSPSGGTHYKGSPIVIEGESAVVKSSYSIVGKTDTSTTKITPQSATHNVINYIGGGNWKTIGEEIVLETPELDEGYYSLGCIFRQNAIIGGKVYRSLKIDGETPFDEADSIGFSYDEDWQLTVFGEKEEPYLFHLGKGKHTISFTVTAGDISKTREELSSAVAMLGDLYIDITMITGENVDIYRDYDLFNQISGMETRVKQINELLLSASENLIQTTGEKSGSYYSVINNMSKILDLMLKNKSNAHRYVKTYYTNYCSVSSVLQELRNMPLDIDKLILFAPGENIDSYMKASLVDSVGFSIKRFISSFVRDYQGISTTNADDSITIWVNWGRDQAQVLSSMIDSSFTPETDINVNLQLVNASVIQAKLSGKGPDVILQHSRSEPVNLAMRNVLYDLSTFSDCDEVLKRFQEGAEIPYRYKNGLYALPDTQTFFVMFYRKDILKKFNLSVPKTWDEFDEVAKLLMRRNMSVWLPNTPATSVAQTNAGVGSINLFPTLLMQNGISLYSEDGQKTNLLSADAMEVFGHWTDYYTKMKFPVTLDFYNRFRIGTTPLGISAYSMYTTIKVAASEIDGLWGIAPVPGTQAADGTVNHTTSGGGTGCAILKNSENPDAAWEFLKWWTSAETQLKFSNNVESILGAAGRVALSNVEAIKSLNWDDGIEDNLLEAWGEVKEIEEYPGSYYVSRSIYQSFWNVVNANENTKDMMMKFGKEANDEISRKWKQYSNR